MKVDPSALKEIKHIKKDITKVLKASDMPNFNTEDKELAEKKNKKAKKRRVGLLVFFSVSFLILTICENLLFVRRQCEKFVFHAFCFHSRFQPVFRPCVLELAFSCQRDCQS